MNVIQGYSNLLSQSLEDDRREHAETISRKAQKLISISEKAHHIGTANDASPYPKPTDIGPFVSTAVEQARSTYPMASISIVGDASARANLVENHDLDTAVTYLVENAIEYNDTATPTVTVAVETQRETVTIAVKDNGLGIPFAEREALTADTETPLDHGSGLGLWVVSWIISRSNGTLRFADNTPRGSIVIIEVPAAN